MSLRLARRSGPPCGENRTEGMLRTYAASPLLFVELEALSFRMYGLH